MFCLSCGANLVGQAGISDGMVGTFGKQTESTESAKLTEISDTSLVGRYKPRESGRVSYKPMRG